MNANLDILFDTICKCKEVPAIIHASVANLPARL